MPARLSAFVIWALVAAGSVFWAYRFWAPRLAIPANVQAVSESAGQRGDLTRLLGSAPVPVGEAAPPPVAESSRFRLLGVLAPKPAKPAAAARPATGVALIAIDGKPPRAFVVGARVDGELVLKAVSHRSASIGPLQGAAGMVLELPPLPPPSTGTLPRAMVGGEAARPPMPGQPIPGMALPQGAPGGPPRSPTFQGQRPGQPQVHVQEEDDADEDEPTPPVQQAPPRAGAGVNPATR